MGMVTAIAVAADSRLASETDMAEDLTTPKEISVEASDMVTLAAPFMVVDTMLQHPFIGQSTVVDMVVDMADTDTVAGMVMVDIAAHVEAGK